MKPTLTKLILASCALILPSLAVTAKENALQPQPAPCVDTLFVPGPARELPVLKEKKRNVRVFPYRNCIRFGIGDMFFETLIWNNQVKMDYSQATDPTGDGFPVKTNYRYTPHFSLEYMRRVLPWLSVGAMMDYQQTMWTTEVYQSGGGIKSSTPSNFFNLIIAPGFRIKYFRREHVEFYGGSFMGICINGGTEYDWRGKQTAIGMGMNYVAFGVEAGVGHWFGFIDLGGTIGMQNFNTIYLMLSQIAKVGVSYRF